MFQGFSAFMTGGNRLNKGIFLAILALVLAWHLVTFWRPAAPVFDEIYYTREAASILSSRVDLWAEAGPLAKLYYTGAIGLAGILGGRLATILVSLVALCAFYLLAGQELERPWSLLAMGLLGLERMTFILGQLVMPDLLAYTAGLWGLVIWYHRRPALAGVVFSLAALCKLTALFLVAGIAADVIINRKWRDLAALCGPFYLSGLATWPVVMFLGLWLLTGQPQNPLETTRAMIVKLMSLTGLHSSSSYAWSWFISWNQLILSVKPLWLLSIGPMLWGLTIPLFIWLCFKRGLAFSWFLGSYGGILALALVSGRTTYLYYILPALGGLVLGLTQFLKAAWERNRNLGIVALGVVISTWVIGLWSGVSI